MILILLVVILAACTGAQPGAAQANAPAQAAAAATTAPTQASALAAEKPVAAPAQVPAATQVKPAAPVPAGNLSQSAEDGAVTVEITPLNLADAKASALDFKVVMNTHSVELGVDLAKLAVLKVGDNEVVAKGWQAPAGSGHHVEGTLSFPAKTADGKPLLADATGFSIAIRNLAGVSERTFTWKLGQAGANTAGGMPMSGTATRGDMGLALATPVTNTTPMGQGSGIMGAGSAITGTMPMSGDKMGMMAEMMKMMQGMMGNQGMMGAGSAITGTMPMSGTMPMNPGGAGMMGMMSGSGMGSSGDTMGMASHAEAISAAGVPDATAKVGGQPLALKVENGVKVFELTARPVRWDILDDAKVTAWTFNGTVPGPMIRVTEGDKVRVVLKNELPEATSIHWHGIPVPNAMDGVTAIAPGESFTYEFTAPPAGSFMYHSHVNSDKQLGLGLYAPFIVDPQTPSANRADVDVSWMLSEWRVGSDGQTYAAMPMAGAEPNYFTINGKSSPNTQPIEAKKGQRVRVRLANVGQFTHPMHLHGMNFKIVAYDGVPLPPEQQIVRNTVPVNPGELVDIEFVADNVGTWMFHCHVLHHVTNDGAEPGGLVALVKVTE
jgi:hypothetical protein